MPFFFWYDNNKDLWAGFWMARHTFLFCHINTYLFEDLVTPAPNIQQSSRNMPDMSGRVLLMSGKGLWPCRTFCPAGFNICRLWIEKNDWHGDQNVRQSFEDLPDILSGRPEIIFARTASSPFASPPSLFTITMKFVPVLVLHMNVSFPRRTHTPPHACPKRVKKKKANLCTWA